MLKKIILSVCCLFPVLLQAQTWTVYDTLNSPLPFGYPIFDLGPNNDLWAVGTKSLLHFDGASWTVYDTSDGMPESTVIGVTVGETGKVYAVVSLLPSQQIALVIYDGTNWAVYDSSNSLMGNCGTAPLKVDRAGTVWIGICSFDGVSWQSLANSPINSGLRQIAVDIFDNKWFATSTNGLVKYDGQTWTTYDTSNSNITSNDIRGVGNDVFGNPWVNPVWPSVFGSTTPRGFDYFDGVQWTNYRSTGFTGNLSSVAVDKDNVKWYGQLHGGLKRFNDTLVISYDTSNSGLPDNRVGYVDIDKAGNKWVSTLLGLAKFSDGGAGSITSSLNISGTVYSDLNSNGLRDSLEPPVVGHIVELLPGPRYTTTDATGKYHLSTDTGSYTVTIYPQTPWALTSSTASYTVHIADSNSITSGYDFGLHSSQNYNDVSVSLTADISRCFRTSYATIIYHNNGFSASQGSITLQFDTLTLTGSTPSFDANTGSSYTWNYASLAPGEQRQIRLTYQSPGTIGAELHFSAAIAPQTPDSNTVNNQDTITSTVICAYDPNDKAANPAGTGAGNYTPYGEELEYTIRFQNTGNDTAFKVVISDTLDAHLFVPSFRLVAASHPVYYKIEGPGNILFTFNNILLPDSNVNEAASHGFVKFTISPKTGLPDSTQVRNTAAIYFDFNEPIITNTTLNTFVQPVAQNSANDILTFTLPEQTGPATIDTVNHTVMIEVVNGTNVTALTPIITVSADATISPASGVVQNFTNPVTYTVTAQSGTTQTWTVTVTTATSSANDILTFTLPQQTTTATIDAVNHTVLIEVVNGTNVTALTPAIMVSAGATISPASGVVQDFTNPVTYTVTAQNGATQTWTVTVTTATSNANDILTFALPQQTTTATIDAVNHTVVIEVANGTNITALAPTVTVSAGATVSPASGTVQDFTNPVMYTVTAENGNIEAWEVTVEVATGIHPVAAGDVRIFPNPATDKLFLQSTSFATWTISISDLSGKRFLDLKDSILPLEIDVTNLPAGIFILQMQSDAGNRINDKLVIGIR